MSRPHFSGSYMDNPPSPAALPLLDADLATVAAAAAVQTSSFARPGGLYELGVVINVSAFSATTVVYTLQGSHDNSNWHSVDTVTVTATGAYSLGGQGVVVPRYGYFRVQALSAGGAGTSTADVVANGIYQGTGFRVASETITVDNANVNGATMPRVSGSLLGTVQVVPTRTDGTATLILQGSPDGTNWIALATETGVTTGPVVFTENGDANVAWGGLTQFRVRVVTSDFTGSFAVYWGQDENDAGRADSVVDPNGINPKAFMKVAITAAAEAGNARDITFTFTNFDGSPVTQVVNFMAVVSNTTLSGQIDLATNATWGAASVGALRAGSGSNRMIGSTNALGVFTISLADLATETVYVSVVPGGAPNTIACVIAEYPELSVAFA